MRGGNFGFTPLVGALVSFFMLASLIAMSLALRDTSIFGDYYSALFFFNLIGLLFLLAIIAWNLKRLISQRRARVMGSRITVRMVSTFTFLSTMPALVLYLFSANFLNHAIDDWVDAGVERAKAGEDALELSRLSLSIRMRELLKTTSAFATNIQDLPDYKLPAELDKMRSHLGAEEVALLSRTGELIASDALATDQLLPIGIDDFILLQLQQSDSYVELDTIGQKRLMIRVAINMPREKERILHALFPIPERMDSLSSNIQSSLVRYDRNSFLWGQLKRSLVIILTLVLLFSIFSAMWAAFHLARQFSRPIKDLAEGTQAVADGDYHTRLPVGSDDELGVLVSSFNDMTVRISEARDAERRIQLEIEGQQRYLKTILAQLSSGVLVFSGLKLVSSNISATRILGVNLGSYERKSLNALSERHPELAEFTHKIGDNLVGSDQDWRGQIRIPNPREETRHLMVGGARITAPDGEDMHIVVLDDITALVRGQRDAAWSEIARRLAHEIKNPLTPIKLAAERLRSKYLSGRDALEKHDALDRLTNTIIHQVDGMKKMVDRFSDYARPVESELQPLNICAILAETVDLYNSQLKSSIMTSLEEVPMINGDPDKLRQMFNNLLKNAIDAIQKLGEEMIQISCHQLSASDGSQIEIRIADSGAGIAEETREQLFEPYFTLKEGGTGLGLAIVKKIVDEHKGQIWLENCRTANGQITGACAVMRFDPAK
ncbi:MAG: sensor histidine kinase [Candidatus Eutrophobiaceae bacterium]